MLVALTIVLLSVACKPAAKRKSISANGSSPSESQTQQQVDEQGRILQDQKNQIAELERKNEELLDLRELERQRTQQNTNPQNRTQPKLDPIQVLPHFLKLLQGGQDRTSIILILAKQFGVDSSVIESLLPFLQVGGLFRLTDDMEGYENSID